MKREAILSATVRLSWQEKVRLTSSDGRVIVAGPESGVVVRPSAPEILAAMERLASPGEDEEQLAESILATGTVDALARWYFHVDEFRQRGLIRRSLDVDGRPWATYEPFCDSIPQQLPETPGRSLRNRSRRAAGVLSVECRQSTSFCVLSRFAYIHLHQAELVVESPLSDGRVILHDSRLMSLLGALAVPCTLEALAQEHDERIRGLGLDNIRALIGLLREAKLVEQLATNDSSEPNAGDTCPGLESWEFHDLLFHSRSRRGRSDGRFGSTYRFPHRRQPAALKTYDGLESLALFRPDLERLEKEDPPLAHVQERRQSLRTYGEKPITARQLGEFLYRVARVKELQEVSAPGSPEAHPMEIASRPYPSGGGLYELEFYIAVNACEELESGLYHYDPLHHRLERIDRATRGIRSLFDEAAASAGIAADTVQVLIVLASRFERIAWKYESIAYSLTLKHVGVVYQTMYLAATAMGLAPCALGCGDSDLFARVARTDYYVETSVGEFLLGSRVSEVQV